MQFSVNLPTDRVDAAGEFVTAGAVAEMAAAIEAAGFGACYVTDHPAPDARWLAGGGHHALDPMVALSFAAAATTRLRLQTHVYVLAYRNPLLSAKAVASLDALSGGRVILGVAPGYLRPEFAALGVDFDERNDLTDEAIDVLRAAWHDDEVAFEGRHFRSRGAVIAPRPERGPPIWVGGNSRAAIRRAVERGDGWVPFPNPPGAAQALRTAALTSLNDLAARLAYLREHAAALGRPAPPDVCCMPFHMATMAESDDERDGPAWSTSDLLDEIGALAALGVTWVAVALRGATRAAFLDQVARFGDVIIAPTRSAPR